MALIIYLLYSGRLAAPTGSSAQTNIVWPQVSLTPVVSGLSQPTHISHAADGTGRLFVVERAGRIRIFKNGNLLTTPFVDISDRVTTRGPEQGLFSVAFPPGYAAKRYFYIYYTNTSGNLVIARYRLTADPDVADAGSEMIVLSINHPVNLNHNGGQHVFGPNDAFLYAGIGDGGGAGDTSNNAQNPNTLLGKLLRIDVETGNPTTYTIPTTNPFTKNADYRGEIWALGLRNPWRFSFDRQTNDLFIADVGQNAREEIDFQPAASTGGQNYGWRCYEGTQSFNLSGCGPSSNYTFPVYDYSSLDPLPECSIIGGFVYRGLRYVLMRGIYFYGDFCSGKIWGLKYDGVSWQNNLLYDAPFSIPTFGEDEAGNLYVADYGNGRIYSIDSQGFSLYLPVILGAVNSEQ